MIHRTILNADILCAFISCSSLLYIKDWATMKNEKISKRLLFLSK
jgi:hypothetical protein